ncbi:hypothetical protein VP1G_07996 [Cytospora mali]|uniref:Uncharacterized protein n=1 Tax=Cytospora mali TaxID=578113 RepID=A0A194VAB1_CYTMA|nr:hypothetical protein VP1G_07996 [Valsa mali var. pyri (nom. inval.)]
MTTPSTLVKRATAAPSLALCKTTIARAAVIAPGPISFQHFYSDSKDDVPRTSTGEPQKLDNFASEIGKKMEKASPGGESSSPAASGSGQGSDKGDPNTSGKGGPGEKD